MKAKLFCIIKKSDVLLGSRGDRKRVLIKKTGNMAAAEPTDKKWQKEIINLHETWEFFFKSNVMYSDCAVLLASPLRYSHHRWTSVRHGDFTLRMLWGVREGVPSAWTFQEMRARKAIVRRQQRSKLWCGPTQECTQVKSYFSKTHQRKSWGGRRWAQSSPYINRGIQATAMWVLTLFMESYIVPRSFHLLLKISIYHGSLALPRWH